MALKLHLDSCDLYYQVRGSLLCPSLSPFELLYYAGLTKQIPKKLLLSQIFALLKVLNLMGNRHRAMGHLSLGDQRKTLIGMELLGCPKFLVFDNIFQHLDYPTTENLKHFLLMQHFPSLRSLAPFQLMNISLDSSCRSSLFLI